MKKIRVYEYAKERKLTSKEVLTHLEKIGMSVKGHMSSIEPNAVIELDKVFSYPKVGNNTSTRKIIGATDEAGNEKQEAPVEKKDGQTKVELQSKPQNNYDKKTGVRSGRPKGNRNSYSSDRQRPNERHYMKKNDVGVKNRVNTESNNNTTSNNQGKLNADRKSIDSNRAKTSDFKQDMQSRDKKYNKPYSKYQGNTNNNTTVNKYDGNRNVNGTKNTYGENGNKNQGYTKSYGQSTGRPQSGAQGNVNRARVKQGFGANTSPSTPPAQNPSTQKPNSLNKKPKKPISKGKPYVSKKSVQEKQKEESRVFRGKKASAVPTPRVLKPLPSKITFSESLTVTELSKKIYRDPAEIIKKLFMMGVVTTINSVLDKEAIGIICLDYGIEVEEIIVVDKTDLEAVIADDDAALNTFERPAVVTIMGHVDHGKTTLLDSIRKTKVTAGEAGGITQHIGAYQVSVNDKKITFLDTPGHEAFTTMRARGAQVTDIAILVVAADDGVKPQTIEAIAHGKAAKVPIIVAVNKVDKAGADIERVRSELSQHGIVDEDWGGDNIFVPISAKEGTGIENLLETILLVCEVGELRCNKDRLALGTVIETKLDKGRGSVATLLVQNGTLRVGDPIVAGNSFGKVRAMINDVGVRLEEALPSMPVEVTGLNGLPQAGDRFVVFEDEKTARSVGEKRATDHLMASRGEKSKVTLDNLFEQLQKEEIREINVIVKTDVHGSQEALVSALRKIEVDGVRVKVILAGVGAISESDVLLAASSNAIVIGFNVSMMANAGKIADTEKVDIRMHKVIYNVINEIEQAMKGLQDPEFEKKVIGKAEVRQLVKISKIGVIAGSYVLEGKFVRSCFVNVIRQGNVIHEGEIKSLKRFKDDVKEVTEGFECGISLQKYNEFEELDILEAYIMEEIPRF